MEGLCSYDKLGFDSCQIQDNVGCVQIGSWDSSVLPKFSKGQGAMIEKSTF